MAVDRIDFFFYSEIIFFYSETNCDTVIWKDTFIRWRLKRTRSCYMQEHGWISKDRVEWEKPDTRGHTEWIHLYEVQKQANCGDRNENGYPREVGGFDQERVHEEGRLRCCSISQFGWGFRACKRKWTFIELYTSVFMLCKLCIKATITRWVRARRRKGGKEVVTGPSSVRTCYVTWATRSTSPSSLERGWQHLQPSPSYCEAFMRMHGRNRLCNWNWCARIDSANMY